MATTINHPSHVMLGKRRVLIVDDHPLVRRGIAELISREADLEVCGEAADSCEALQQIKSQQPDVVVVDLSLRGGHGIELIEQVKQTGGATKMVVLSVYDEALFAERALRAGAMGYVNKQEPHDHLIDAIHEVLRGQIYLSAAMSSRLLHSVVGGQPLNHDPIKTLSNRELEIFEMIGDGMATKKIAGKLQLSSKTIESHREKIKMKLNLSNSAELNRRAVQWVLEKR
jgi:DNA-binding NarL/FixJ family response regulator